MTKKLALSLFLVGFGLASVDASLNQLGRAQNDDGVVIVSQDGTGMPPRPMQDGTGMPPRPMQDGTGMPPRPMQDGTGMPPRP